VAFTPVIPRFTLRLPTKSPTISSTSSCISSVEESFA